MFAEFLDQRGRVRRRERLTGFPVSLGRARTNAIIIDDPKVCPLHAELTEDAERGLVLRDLGSVNGTRRAGYDKPLKQLTVTSGTTIMIGDTVLRIVSADHPVPATVVDRRPRLDGLAPLQGTRPALAATGALVLVLAIFQALAATWDSPAAEALISVLAFLSLGVMWAGFWTLVNRLVAREYRFAEHLFWGMLVGTVVLVSGFVSDYARFMMPGSGFVEFLFGLVGIAAVCAAFYGHFSIVGSSNPGRRMFMTVGILTAFSAVAWLATDLGENDFFSGLSFDYPIRPVPTALISTTTPDAFFEQVDQLRIEVDELIDR